MESQVDAAGPKGEGPLSTEALFRAHAAFVAGFVARLGVAQAAVDDVVQEVFLTVHRLGGYTPGPARPTSWLAAVAVRVVSTHKRGERRRRAVPDEDTVHAAVSAERTPLDAAEQREALARVDQALGALDVDRRAIFILYEIEGEPCDTIAAAFGIPVGTVHSRLFTARRTFLEAYARIETRRPKPRETTGERTGRGGT